MVSELGIGIASSFLGMVIIVFWKRAPYIYIYTYSFPKHDLRTWHWHCKLISRNGPYCVSEKSSLHTEKISGASDTPQAPSGGKVGRGGAT